ncbi:hypothetical protein [Actinosynnema sp. ALI-1.44]|uniref:hypothetical protein n=1 Tax=Actinosynnema sp. ALI-1.44 TaxID=1933779 RepID=UPI0011778579|nr:hypothetical protein [Actinosynnema sp. ALI-1.44]
MPEQLAVPFRPVGQPPHIPLTEMTRDQVLDYVIDRHRQRNQIDGEIVQAYARFAELTPPQRSGITIGD